MGTNYYAIPNVDQEEIKTKIIEKIKSDDFDEAIELIQDLKTKMVTGIHIGKSSCGWKFCFDHNNWKYFEKDKQSIVDFINSCEIINEYNSPISTDEFWKLVESKKDGIDNREYYTNWNKYNKDFNGNPIPRPSYIPNDYGEFYVDELKFSTSTDFC